MNFSFDSIKKLFIGKPGSFSCKNIEHGLFIDENSNVRVCPYSEKGILINNFNGLGLNIELLTQKRKELFAEFKVNNFDLCKNCEFANTGNGKLSKKIKSLYIYHWKNCYCDCSYCKRQKTDNLLNSGHYDITQVIEQLFDDKITDTDTKIILQCGDATIHPEFDKLIYYLIKLEVKYTELQTPCLTYRDSAADAVSQNKLTVAVNLDSGNTNVYKHIKNMLSPDTAIENIKRYIKFQEPGEKRIISSFLLVKGSNDSKKEITDWFRLSCDLGINKLRLDIEQTFFEEIKSCIPEYLKEIIVFTKQISELNETEIELSDKVIFIYNQIKKPERYTDI